MTPSVAAVSFLEALSAANADTTSAVLERRASLSTIPTTLQENLVCHLQWDYETGNSIEFKS